MNRVEVEQLEFEIGCSCIGADVETVEQKSQDKGNLEDKVFHDRELKAKNKKRESVYLN